MHLTDAERYRFGYTLGADVIVGTRDMEERTRVQLDRLGLEDVPLDRRLHTLSGGQVVSLGLAAQLLKRPDVLLLDEPTNNLDLDARHKHYDVREDWQGCLLLVSHDWALLDRMDRIAELDKGEVRFYGGNFTAYEQAVRAAREVAEKNVRNEIRNSSGRKVFQRPLAVDHWSVCFCVGDWSTMPGRSCG